jgi:crotonobetainyl-CoA:carnitine CoA-transferase CaiB-like acyl-CoA transferase
MITQQNHPVAGKMPMVANAIKAQGDPFTVERPAPELGQHTDEVLTQIGYSQEKIADLKERGVIVQNDV